MGAVTEKGGETRARLLAGARHAFAERGYAGTSLSEILRAADLTKGGFYFHFTSKAELAVAVVADVQAQMTAEIQSYIVGDTALERLVGLVRGACIACSGGSELHALKRICEELADDPTTKGRVDRPYERWVGVTAALVAEAQAEGDVPADIDANAAALMAVATFFGLDEIADARGERLETYADAYIEFTLAGLRARRPA